MNQTAGQRNRGPALQLRWSSWRGNWQDLADAWRDRHRGYLVDDEGTVAMEGVAREE